MPRLEALSRHRRFWEVRMLAMHFCNVFSRDYFQPMYYLIYIYLNYFNCETLHHVFNDFLSDKIFPEIHSDLTRLGKRVEEEVEPLGIECELNPPFLWQSDAWGKRVDEICKKQRLFTFTFVKNN